MMTLIAIGGAEDKQNDMTILRRVLAEAKGTASRVCVITTATSEPEATRQRYLNAFAALGAAHIDVRHIDTRAGAADDDAVAAVENADVVFFSGGDQMRITSLLAATPVADALTRRFDGGDLVVAGTSAGAAAASSLMIYGGEPADALKKGGIRMTSGLSLARGIAFDTHFNERARLPRLFNAVATNPAVLGIGLDENTGVVLQNGVIEVIGTGKVTVVDGRGMTENTMADVETGESFRAEGLRVTSLSAGDTFDVISRRSLTV